METMTWRPRRGRVVPYAFAAVLIVMAVILAVALPGGFEIADRVALVVLCGLLAAGLHVLARARVTADGDGVTVVNGLRTHRVPWDAIAAVRLAEGDPWLQLELTDGSTLGAMGVQAADGEQARRAAGALRDLRRNQGRARRRT